MKSIHILLVFVCCSTLFGQANLDGEFCTIPIGESDVACYNFEENQQFEYKVTGCLGISTFGKGKYQLKRGNLFTNFEEGNANQNSTVNISKLVENTKDSITIKINVKDNDGIGIPANIYPKGMDLLDIDFETNMADIKGDLVWKEKKKDKTNIYKVLFVGYEVFEISIKTDESQKIEIILAPPSPKSLSSKKFKRKFKIIHSDTLEIDGTIYRRIK